MGKVEKILGKDENACYQHFLLFPPYFPNSCSTGSLKVVVVWERNNPLPHDSKFQ